MAKRSKCQFDDEFIDAVKYMLYHTNAGAGAANPPHPSWYTAANYPENSIERYEERNEKSNQYVLQDNQQGQ